MLDATMVSVLVLVLVLVTSCEALAPTASVLEEGENLEAPSRRWIGRPGLRCVLVPGFLLCRDLSPPPLLAGFLACVPRLP